MFLCLLWTWSRGHSPNSKFQFVWKWSLAVQVWNWHEVGVHYNYQFKKYVYCNNKCADPCQRHARPRKTRLAVIEIETARIVKNNTKHGVIPGQSVCQECRQFLMELVTHSEHQEEHKKFNIIILFNYINWHIFLIFMFYVKMFGCQTKANLILKHILFYVKIFLKSKVLFKMSNAQVFLQKYHSLVHKITR